MFERRPGILSRMVVRLGKSGRHLSFCYEAGPCGYGLYRMLTGCEHSCVVVTTATAREMVGFIWAIARVAQPVLV